MLRVLVFVAFVFLISAGLAWLAERPGDLVLQWQGYEIRTSLMIAALAVAAAFAVLAILWTVIRAIVRAPKSFEHYLGRRRQDRGYKALSDGMIAVGGGDVRAAKKAAEQSRTLLGAEPLPLLLSAQAAQLAGDADGARTSFEALAARPETRVLGLHGLFIEARRQDEHVAARHFAEEAAQNAPKIGWAGEALFEYQSRSGEWLGAMRTLEANVKAGTIDKASAQKQRAALLTARAMELEAGAPEEARAAAQEAHRLDPSLVPAAVVASRLLSRLNDFKRATKVLETTWKLAPHPDLAEAYATVRPGDSVRDRLKRMRRLADLRANHPEGAMAAAHAAIDAHEWDTARTILESQAKGTPTEGVCLLMAEIEEREHGDRGKVRMWLARAVTAARGAVWMADGEVFEHWAPVSPVSGRVGVFEWKVPTEAPPSRVALEIEADLAAEPPMVVAEDAPRIEDRSDAIETVEPVPTIEPEPPTPPEPPEQPKPPEPPAPVEAAVEPPVEKAETQVEPVAEAPAKPEPEPRPEPQPEPPAESASDQPIVAPNGSETAADGPEAVEDVPTPRPPDDPGPMPDEEAADERPRRFRLF